MEQHALRAACTVAREHGVPCDQAAVAYSGSNVLVHLRPSPVVARVMTGTVVLHEDPEAWLKREVSVLSFLAPSGLAVAPSPLISPGPHRSDGLWMTFWEWVAHRGSELRDGAERLGRALRELHDELFAFRGELAGLGDLQRDIDRLLQQLRPAGALTSQRIDSLRARLFDLSDAVFASSLPAQALHGDASLSNLLCAGGRLVWNDFEDTFHGPVHWDLTGYLISLEARGADPDFVDRVLEAYGGVDQRELAPFTVAHDVYDEIWGLYDTQRRGSPT